MNRRITLKLVIGAAIFVEGIFALGANAATRYVDASCGNNAWSGTSQTCAAPNGPKRTIQAGIDASVTGDTLWVKPGTYAEFVRFWTRGIGKGVTVESTNGPAVTTITLRQFGGGAALVKFDCASNVCGTNHGTLAGFTITGSTGRGIEITSASPTIRGNVISGNGDSGIYLLNSSALIEDNTICKNTAFTGGGIYATALGNPYNLTIRRCRIEGNTALNSDGTDGTGGGVRVVGLGSTVTISRCVIRNNQTARQGAGIFTADVSSNAGGCSSFLNFTIENSLVFRNTNHLTPFGDGGGISLGECTNATIRNCTITENFARDHGGGIAILATGTTNIHNSILWGNRAGIEGQQIGIVSLGGYTLTVEWSDVEGVVWPGTGNKNADPKFCNASADDYHLMSFAPPSQPSQVIDAGNNSLISAIVDYDNQQRKVDDPNTPDTGSGTPPIVDMGAYEYQNAGCSAGGLALACPTCKTGAIDSATPASGTRDARQPHPEGSTGVAVPPSQRQGIGSPYPMNGPSNSTEPITVTLRAAGAPVTGESNLTCWGLCETGIEQVESPTLALNPNRIISVKETVPGSSGVYQILLERPISGGHWTAISYLGGSSSVSYASLPADVNGDGTAAPADILDLIDCCLNQVCTPPYGSYSCDIDHSGVVAPADQLTLVDLLNGAGNFIVWNGRTLPANSCAGAGLLALEPAQLVSAEDENREFADWFVNYLTTANPADSLSEEDFRTIVDSLTQWCVDHFTAVEQAALAERLSDPALTFVSRTAEGMVPAIAEALRP